MSRPRQLSRSAKDRLPTPIVGAARQAVLGWGIATADLRMLPSVVVVGAQRCGTTTLFRILSDHPDIVRPTASKGTGYFDANYARGPRWYRAHFPVRSGRFRPGKITFESSGYYSFHPLAAGRIARDLPGVRVVMMVRDPVERAFSAYKHEHARGYETETFERALELESERLTGEVERLTSDPGYESFSHRHHAYTGRGQYAEQLDRLAEVVGRANVYAVDADRFFASPQSEFARLNDWLGLQAWTPAVVDRWNARESAPMPAAIRKRLADHFVPHDEALAAYLGEPPSWR